MDITITKVREKYGFLSCMSPHPVQYQGIIYRTAEALFQCLRFHKYPKIQEEIRSQKSPMAAKMKARKHRSLLNRGKKWDEAPVDLSMMQLCLKLKFEQHPQLKRNLIETGNAKIIEDCTTHDRESARFWGAVRIDGKWVGENILGKLLMELRSEFQEEIKELTTEQGEIRHSP
jgi:N-glycosidase YbiA